MKALVGAFNQKDTLVSAFYVIVILPMVHLQLFLTYLCQEPLPVGGPHLDGDLLAAAHPHEEGGAAPPRQGLQRHGGAQGEAVCLLEKISTTIGWGILFQHEYSV